MRQKTFFLDGKFRLQLEAAYYEKWPVFGRNGSNTPLTFNMDVLRESLVSFIHDPAGLTSLDVDLFEDVYNGAEINKSSGFSRATLYRCFNPESVGSPPSRDLIDLLHLYVYSKKYEECVSAELVSNRISSFRLLRSKRLDSQIPPRFSNSHDYSKDALQKGSELELSPTIYTDLKKAVANALEVEYDLYRQVPDFSTTELERYFIKDESAFNRIINYAEKYVRLKLVINNKRNPSTYQLYDLTVLKISKNEAIVQTEEYWLMTWYNPVLEDYPEKESYNIKNKQIYTLKRTPKGWKIKNNFFPEYDLL